MRRTNAVLIAAASGRALAASARRGGYVPLVADFFGDQDTAVVAHAHIRLDDGLTRGMSASGVLAALASLATQQKPAGIVCGTGFEDRPALLAAIAERWELFGNGPAAVTRAKDPLVLAKLCRDYGVAHPDTILAPPMDPAGWLMKRRGGAGGRHIRSARDGEFADGAFYFQRRVDGLPVSALMLADGRRAMVLGFSAQWSSPTPSQPFRYGGAVQPAVLPSDIAAGMIEAVQRLTAIVPLIGLNSIDFLVRETDFQLLEINPRPGATLDIFESEDGSIFAMHIAACEGVLPQRQPTLEQAKASAIVYSPRDIPTFPPLDWPAWTADRPGVGTSVNEGDPLCTVLASASNATSARELAEQRSAQILAITSANLP
jgi:predicted ATP-grasp superfamily ATP-dependent carboligase